MAKQPGKNNTKEPRNQPYAFRYAVRKLAASSESLTTKDIQTRLLAILTNHLKTRPRETITLLLPNKQTFTVDKIVDRSFAMLIEEALALCPDFEMGSDGRWNWKDAPQVGARPPAPRPGYHISLRTVMRKWMCPHCKSRGLERCEDGLKCMQCGTVIYID